MKAVELLVKNFPKNTGPELSEWSRGSTTGFLDEYQVRRRLTDLKNKGRVFQTEARRCKLKGTMMVTWDIPGHGEDPK